MVLFVILFCSDMPSNIRLQYVCFTSFDENAPKYESSTMSYLCYGRERCSTTGRLHWQCYVEFKTRVTQSTIRTCFGSVHFERRKGSSDQAVEYCRKEGEFTEFGSRMVSQQGKRTDLDRIGQHIINGQSLTSIAMEFPGKFIQYGRGFQQLDATTRIGRLKAYRHVNVEIWWGKTGMGKTRKFYDNYFPNCYRFQYNKNNDW